MKLAAFWIAFKDTMPTAWPATRRKLYSDRLDVAVERFDHTVFLFRQTKPRRPAHANYLSPGSQVSTTLGT